MSAARKRGFTLLELMIVIAIIAIIAAIAIPNLKSARLLAYENQAIANLRTIHTAQALYRDLDGNGTLDYAYNVRQLVQAEALSETFFRETEKGVFDGYQIFQGQYYSTPWTATAFTWSFLSCPELPGESGVRYFKVDQSGVIRYCVGQWNFDDWPSIGK